MKYKPNYAEAYFYKGFCLVQLEQYKEAIENFNLAIKINLIMQKLIIIKDFVSMHMLYIKIVS
ncbi:tetratricopeptide repeat protein [Orientia tsutsugamushi]|uniref:tetratricopeptide repeat protein n=1 Tax=Orientia tsutsugamushi TaxID=784 RepID=UPI002093EB98|nr:tetratricopeptide repeat protein [Orientia tsutsugamushi]